MKKVIITVAVTGAETTRQQQPNLPITPDEIAASAADACKAGASICHLHVRTEDSAPTQDPSIFAEAIRKIRTRCDIVIEVTTGGAVGMSDAERLAPVALAPEMASLDCGSVNFGDEVLVNTMPQLREYASKMREAKVKPTLECFDLGHVTNAAMLVKEGFIEKPYYFSFVLGVPGGVPANMRSMIAMIDALPQDSTWAGIGIGGKASAFVGPATLVLGGNPRVGFEDNIYIEKGVLAKDNAELVDRIVHLAGHLGLAVASPGEARRILGLRE